MASLKGKSALESNNFILSSLKEISELFLEAKVKFCLAGGIAVGILSSPRATEDIDLIVAIGKGEEELILSVLKRKFSIVQSKDIVIFSFGKLWRLILRRNDSVELLILDLIIAESKMLNEAIYEAFTIEVDNIPIPVISKNNLIRMKTGSSRLKDQADIEALTAEPEL